MEKDDIEFIVECFNNIDSYEHDPITQVSREEKMKEFDNPTQLAMVTEPGRFIIEKKDGTKIGFIAHYFILPTRLMEIGYGIVPGERSKGYGTEAVQVIVDYLFLTKDVVRIQAVTNVGNKSSQGVLDKAGFTKEGTLRKVGYVKGEWTNAYIYSILREEWKEPKTLTKTSK